MEKWINADALSRYFYEEVSLSHWMHSRLNTAEKAMGKTREIIENFPAADVAPVRHGKWVKAEGHGGVTYSDAYAECSACHGEPVFAGHRMDYCPRCGAKMDGGDGDD